MVVSICSSGDDISCLPLRVVHVQGNAYGTDDLDDQDDLPRLEGGMLDLAAPGLTNTDDMLSPDMI